MFLVLLPLRGGSRAVYLQSAASWGAPRPWKTEFLLLSTLLDEIRAGFVLLIEVWVSVGCCYMLPSHLHWLQINICVFNPHVLSPKRRDGMCVDFWCWALVSVHDAMVLARKGGWEEKPPDLLHDRRVPLGLGFKHCHHFALPELRLLSKAGREGLPRLQNEWLEQTVPCLVQLGTATCVTAEVLVARWVEVTALCVRASRALFLSSWTCWLLEEPFSGVFLPSEAVQEVNSFSHAPQGRAALQSVNKRFSFSVTLYAAQRDVNLNKYQ